MGENGEKPYGEWGDVEREAMMKSEVDGGADLNRLPVGMGLEIETQNTIYLLERRPDGFYISGNQKYCPEPTKIEGPGSNFGGSAFKPDFIGREMFMEFITSKDKRIVTSRVKDIREVSLPDKKE